MNLKELIEATLLRLEEERDDATYLEKTSDTEGIGAKDWINEAYSIVMQENYRLYKTVAVILDSNSAFDASSLVTSSERVLSIKKIAKPDSSYPLSFCDGSQTDEYIVYCVEPNTSVNIEFYYMPAMLDLETDAPVFPAEYHACLADYAAHKVLLCGGSSKQQKQIYFLNAFNARRSTLSPRKRPLRIPARRFV